MSIPCVLVTGSSRGLGKGVALALAQAGMNVAIHYASNGEAAAETAAACKAVAPNPDQKFPTAGGDVGDAAARAHILSQTLDQLGHLDALVNNAGITSPGRKDILEATEEAWDRVMQVNLKGPHFLSQAVANYWLANLGQCRLSTGYKLIFVTSVSATMASLNRADYCVSKAGVGMSAQTYALRLAEYGIQVAELRPGIMETDMTSGVKGKYDPMIESGLVPQRRWGQPEDVGRAVRAILQGDFPFSTGAAIYLDGGLNLSRL